MYKVYTFIVIEVKSILNKYSFKKGIKYLSPVCHKKFFFLKKFVV